MPPELVQSEIDARDAKIIASSATRNVRLSINNTRIMFAGRLDSARRALPSFVDMALGNLLAALDEWERREKGM